MSTDDLDLYDQSIFVEFFAATEEDTVQSSPKTQVELVLAPGVELMGSEVTLELPNPPDEFYSLEVERVLVVDLGIPTPPSESYELEIDVYLDSCDGQSMLGCIDDACPVSF